MNKRSGVLCHISSLPGKYGIGNFGEASYKFIDWLSECGFSYWEILPLNATSYSNSPYQTNSAFAINPYFIDYDDLIDRKLLNSRDFQGLDFFDNARTINYKKIYGNNTILLMKAFKRFNKNDYEFNKFKNNQLYYDYAIYMALKERNGMKAWYDWKIEDRYYNSDVKNDLEKNNKDLIDYYFFVQYMLKLQWDKLHAYAKSKGIDIIGEIPHFLDFDSDAVYLHNEQFMLSKFNMMDVVAGFPPDEFTSQGQRWGEPLYDWSYMRTTNYKWWKERINQSLELFDYVKINHFSGFYKVYGINFRDKTNKNGSFYFGPGDEIFENYPRHNIFASDLGAYYKDVEEFVKKTEFKPLRTTILGLFYSTKPIYERFLPSNLEENSLSYIGNHDNATLKGKLEEIKEDDRKALIEKLRSECKKLRIDFDEKKVSMNHYLYEIIINLLLKSKAKYVTLTMQDILYRGNESRMNRPGIYSETNWVYRFLESDLTQSIKEKLKELNLMYDRNI